jgi:hypothetical protein
MSSERSQNRLRGPGGADRTGDGSGSRPSMTNRQEGVHRDETAKIGIDPKDMPEGTARRPLSVSPGVSLRDEARMVNKDGAWIPMDSDLDLEVHDEDEVQSRPWHRVVSAFRNWHHDYLGSHIEFENGDGDLVRSELENSYMPSYGDRYYAKLKDLERGVDRRWDDLTTVMVTLSASTLNANGKPRCPADHMREVAEGWRTARKQLHQVLNGRTWTYARVWEPTSGGGHGPAGYGHMHVAVFLEDGDDLDAGAFRPVMESYVRECDPAGWEAHRPKGTPCDAHEQAEQSCKSCKNPVSVSHDVNNLGTYISEYIGAYGEELMDRPMHVQAFYATCWASRTRRVEFGGQGMEGAQGIINGEQFRRETGLRPEDRGDAGDTDADSEAASSDGDGEDGEGWDVHALCTVSEGRPNYYDPTTGGIEAGNIDGRPGMDPPKDMGGPPD